ncbi:MAG: hypothetical protein ACEQSQ_10495 [Candidatus Paceibacteria bacterium]
MQTSMYKQRSLQDELLEVFSSMFTQLKSFLYKHHTLIGYF